MLEVTRTKKKNWKSMCKIMILITEIKGKHMIFRVVGFVKSVKCRVNKLERGVIIFYKKDLKIEEVKNIKYDTEEWECVGIKIKNILGNDKIVILGVYRKPEMNTTIGI